jgi:hypothetical protein
MAAQPEILWKDEEVIRTHYNRTRELSENRFHWVVTSFQQMRFRGVDKTRNRLNLQTEN